MRIRASQRVLERRRSSARSLRRKNNEAPAIHYFHQVDDPYSFIMAQQLSHFAAAIDIPITPHLVSGPTDAFKGDASRYDRWAMEDASSIAPFLGAPIPVANGFSSPKLPAAEQISAANAELAALLANKLARADFFTVAQTTGNALWRHQLSPSANTASQTRAEIAVNAGNKRRQRLGHYQGGTLYFDGEWYWGADRLPHLFKRLAAESYAKTANADFNPYEAGSQAPLQVSGPVAEELSLEYFPSLRSPYSAVAHPAVEALVNKSQVGLELRPVMPMLMRGVTAPTAKQRYILTDCAREAQANGVPFGNFVDPFGEPVKRGFALFPGALAQGKGMAFIGAYLQAAFAAGIDIDSKKGLRQVLDNAGLDWEATVSHNDSTSWPELLESNVSSMLDAGLWGVPSFRISSPGEPDFCCWGQDRIWRVEHELALRSRQLAA